MSRREPKNGCPWCGEMPEVVNWWNGWKVSCLGKDCEVHPGVWGFYRRIDAVRAWDRRHG